MSQQTRWIVVDDRDSQITYSGSWSSISGDEFNGRGSFGSTYLNTLRSSTSTGSTLTFSFIGDAARIMGTMLGRTTDPEWECILDGVVQEKESAWNSLQNNMAFCKFYELAPGPHTISLRVTRSSERAFLFDQIQYKPTGRVDNQVTYITRADPNLAYDSTWQPLGHAAHMTHRTGGTLELRFIGTQVAWYASYPSELAHADSTASYTLDGGAPVSITVPGGGNDSDWNRLLFTTPRVNRGEHTLRVTYHGRGSQTPLVLSHLLVTDGTTQLVSPPPPIDTSPAPPTDDATPGGGTPTSTDDDEDSGDSAPGSAARSRPRPSPSDSANPNIPGGLSDSDTEIAPSEGLAVLRKSSTAGSSPTDISSGGGIDGNTNTSDSKGLPVGAIVGAVLGCLAFLVLVVGILVFLKYRRRRNTRNIFLPNSPQTVQPFYAAGYSDASNPPMASVPAVGQGENQGQYGSPVSLPPEQGSMSAGLPSSMSGLSNPSAFSPQINSGFSPVSSTTNLLQPLRKGSEAPIPPQSVQLVGHPPNYTP